jgi:hypothetical protein
LYELIFSFRRKTAQNFEKRKNLLSKIVLKLLPQI